MTPVSHPGIHHNNMKLELVEYTVFRNKVLQDTLRIKNPSIEIKNDMTVFTGTNGTEVTVSFSVPTKAINLYGLSLAYTQIYNKINYGTPEHKTFNKENKTVVDKYYVDTDPDLTTEITLFYKNPSYTESTQYVPAKNSATEYLEALSKDYENLLTAQTNKNNSVKEYQFFTRIKENNKKNLSDKIKENTNLEITDEQAIAALKNLLRNNAEALKELLNHEKQ